MKHRIIGSLAITLAILGALVAPNFALAQDTGEEVVSTFSVESIGEQIGLGGADLKDTVINIIQLVLGLMTLIAVVLIIWGGFLWLTSAGNEDRIDKAKKTISAAAIGLVIILLAWAIVLFVARTTANVTQETEL